MTFCLQSHSCALSSGGAVSCWGSNDIGQVMLVVLYLRGAVALFKGGWSNVFVADDVFCFRVQVGDGSTTRRNTPVSVSGLGSGIAMIALGGVRCVAIASGRYVVLERSLCT